ncbi:hypothetical protein LTA6_001816 [Microbacterium sp. LTA6]|uniref:hypothetical protein n=1 Tax=unclassified Microbacterium TaxID=2609290 RepID=UPI00313913C0
MNIDRKLRTRLLLALPIAAVAFSLAACAGPARPSVDKVAEGIHQVFVEQGQEDVVTKDVATCLAEVLVDSKLSDETLNYIANGEDKQKDIADRDLTTKLISENIQECAEKSGK